MNIAEIQNLAHSNSVSHGFWEGEFNFGEKMMLIVSEVAEAFEHWREGKHPTEIFWWPTGETVEGKPDGVPIELADVIIRILDLAAYYNIDLEQAILTKMKYNASRPHRHGGKLA